MSRLPLVMVVLALMLTACASGKVTRNDLRQAQGATTAGRYEEAIRYWNRVIKAGKLTDKQLLAAYLSQAEAMRR